jgi:hypothetical protein
MAVDQQKLEAEFVFSGQGTPAELTVDLDRIASIDARLKSKVRMIRWSALAVFVWMVVMAATVSSGFSALAIILPIGILIYSAVAASRGILQERVSFLRLILDTLSHDAGKRGRFKVTMHLRITREPVAGNSHTHKRAPKEKFFRDTWLTLDGRLGDGTSIHQSCIDLIRLRMKKNARGKTKTKERRICLLRVRLDYDSAIYGDASLAAHKLASPFRMPLGAALKAASFTPKALAMKTIVKGDLTPPNLLKVSQALMLGGYRILNLSRQAATAGGPR